MEPSSPRAFCSSGRVVVSAAPCLTSTNRRNVLEPEEMYFDAGSAVPPEVDVKRGRGMPDPR